MSESKNRRTFIQRLAAVSSGLLFAIKSGLANETKETMKTTAILNKKPLGFQWETQDPFLFCVHHEDFFPKGNKEMGPDEKELKGRQLGQDFIVKDGWRMYHGTKVPGFPGHPHRGFETITVVRKGMVDHTDSLGAAGRYGDGDVQWMTSGKGVLHAEMFPLIHEDQDNPMELFQIWLNLPRAHKFVEPHFKMLWADTIPKHESVDSNNKKTLVEVIAGNLNKSKAPAPPPDSWAAPEENDVAIWTIQMDAGAAWTLPAAAENTNRTIYFFKGDELTVAGEKLQHYHAAEVVGNQELELVAGNEGAYILVLQGKPIDEPVVQHGPFVMNTKQEIQEAFAEYQNTQFGGWPWPVWDPVHDKSKGRFALHADGKEEIRN